MVILASSHFRIGRVKCFISSSEFELLRVSQLIKLIRSLLSFIKVIINCLDLGIIVLALPLLESDGIT